MGSTGLADFAGALCLIGFAAGVDFTAAAFFVDVCLLAVFFAVGTGLETAVFFLRWPIFF